MVIPQSGVRYCRPGFRLNCSAYAARNGICLDEVWLMDHVLTRIAQDHPYGRIIVQGREDGRYIVSIDPEWIYLQAEGDPPASELLAIFERVRKMHPLSAEQSVLFDVRHFTGTIDWDAVSELHNRLDWKQFRRFSIAHLVRDSGFALLVKIIGVIFPEAHHKAFREQTDAEAWLHEEARSGAGRDEAQKIAAYFPRYPV